ncbi:MAG TPA: DUF6036 family nucleotidyltransferase [Patescibacteria group bacterium]|nr:DUF6036 family nucleotidyltransferase [Patescibacteria group bacterium]
MSLYKQMAKTIHEMEKIAKLFNIEPFPIYFLGGSACLLGRYTERATKRFDFIDLNYSSKLGKIFIHLRDYDILKYQSTALSPSYINRAIQLNEFEYLQIFILSKEDIIVSKIIRLAPKDIEDIDKLIIDSDKAMINTIISEVLDRSDLFQSKKDAFSENLDIFRERYHV